jgi:hypothetical protein
LAKRPEAIWEKIVLGQAELVCKGDEAAASVVEQEASEEAGEEVPRLLGSGICNQADPSSIGTRLNKAGKFPTLVSHQESLKAKGAESAPQAP